MAQLKTATHRTHAAGQSAITVDPEVAQKRLAALDEKRRGRGKLAERKSPFAAIFGAIAGATTAYVMGQGSGMLDATQVWILTALGLGLGALYWLVAISIALFILAAAVLG